MKRYYNISAKEWYIEGNVLTKKLNNGVFSGIPTEEQLKIWGYEEYTSPISDGSPEKEARQQRMSEILYELQSMDYLTSKFIDGEDMSAYGDWQERRKALREEYRKLENNE